MTLKDRLSRRIADAHAAWGAPLIVGLCGPQGSGKSTLAAAVARSLEASGLRPVVLSIDDVYLTRAERHALARRVHPLLAVRGPPGTHDLALANAVLDALVEGRPVALPRFDKARDDRCDPTASPMTDGPVDVVILEGWCVGARPQDPAELATPINALEREEDADGVWRGYVNTALATGYQALFARVHLLVLLQAPGFDAILPWRQEQERKLRARSPSPHVMTDVEVARFVQLYERLSRHIAREGPARADVVVSLDRERRPVAVAGAELSRGAAAPAATLASEGRRGHPTPVAGACRDDA